MEKAQPSERRANATLFSQWNHPGNYNKGSFDSCTAKDVSLPPGVCTSSFLRRVYPTELTFLPPRSLLETDKKNGQLSTWYQGQKPTPAAHAPAASSKCQSFKTIGGQAKYRTSSSLSLSLSFFRLLC